MSSKVFPGEIRKAFSTVLLKFTLVILFVKVLFDFTRFYFHEINLVYLINTEIAGSVSNKHTEFRHYILLFRLGMCTKVST